MALDQVGNKFVSTVFLGLDHSFGFGGPPPLFETAIFDRDDRANIDMWRYSTWDEAMAGHKAACNGLTSGLTRKELEQARVVIEGLVRNKH